MFAVQPQLHRLHAQHPVDRKMRSEIPQEPDIGQIVQPLGIIDHDCVCRAIAESQVLLKHLANALLVVFNVLIGQKRAGRILAGRVADLCRTTAHKNNRLVPGALQNAQHHDLHKRTNMQAVSCAIKADIGRNNLFGGALIQTQITGDLVNITAFSIGADQHGVV